MPTFMDVIDANKFWTADESDIFSLPIVAIALGIGRNKMCKIPVSPIIIDKRKCYRKKDILDWALAEQEKGKDSLLLLLRAENSSIGSYEKAKSQAYDQIPRYGVNGVDERINKDALARRLENELMELNRDLSSSSVLKKGIEEKRKLAVNNYNQLAELEPYSWVLNQLKGSWWRIDDFRERQIAPLQHETLSNEIADNLESLGMLDEISYEDFDSLFNMSESERSRCFQIMRAIKHP